MTNFDKVRTKHDPPARVPVIYRDSTASLQSHPRGFSFSLPYKSGKWWIRGPISRIRKRCYSLPECPTGTALTESVSASIESLTTLVRDSIRIPREKHRRTSCDLQGGARVPYPNQ